MHKLLFGLLVLVTSTSFSQDSLAAYSYYFESNKCNGFTPIDGFTKTNFNGNYKLIENKYNQMRVTAGDELIIDEKGLYIQKNKLLSISREEVRENSKYIVINGYLHGVLVNDSIPTFLQDESYYFLVPTKSFLFDSTSDTQRLYKINGSYVILSKEDNRYYSALSVSITNGLLTLAELDLTYSAVNSIDHTITSENDIKTFIINPTKKDWNNILVKAFVVYDSYTLK